MDGSFWGLRWKRPCQMTVTQAHPHHSLISLRKLISFSFWFTKVTTFWLLILQFLPWNILCNVLSLWILGDCLVQLRSLLILTFCPPHVSHHDFHELLKVETSVAVLVGGVDQHHHLLLREHVAWGLIMSKENKELSKTKAKKKVKRGS